MQTFITIIYIIVALVMVLSILLQAGKGGGLGSALGGGASQGVFGGGGGADFMSKLTQGFAATFMICAMYLAYASAHAGSDFLAEEDKGAELDLSVDDSEINYEQIGYNPQPLPTPEEGKAMQAKASALVPAQSDAPTDAAGAPGEEPGVAPGDSPEAAPEDDGALGTDPTPAPAEGDDNADRGDSPDAARGESPQRDAESLQEPSAAKDQKGDDSGAAKNDSPAPEPDAE